MDSAKVEAAMRLVRKTFDMTGWTEGTIEAALKLCSGLMVDEGAGVCVGYFRYWPNLGPAVEMMDVAELERADLETGPLLHFAVWIAPVRSFLPVRELIKTLNPWGVTCHRFKRGEFRFACQKNRHFVVDGGRLDGKRQRRQQQEQE